MDLSEAGTTVWRVSVISVGQQLNRKGFLKFEAGFLKAPELGEEGKKLFD